MVKSSKPKLKITIIILDIIKVVCVVSVLVVAIQKIPPFFKHKDVIPKLEINTPAKSEVTNGKKGSIDVISIGNSSLYSGFNPLQMWKEHGFTSFVGAAPQQNMCLSYYMFKELLTVQSPKLLILETSNFFENRGNTAVKENLKLAYTYCYSAFRDTDRWQEMVSKGVVQTKNQSLKLVTRGYYYSSKVEPNNREFAYMQKSNNTIPVSSYTEKYLPRIMELAKRNNIKVMFVVIPCAAVWSYEKHNTVDKLAKEYQVDFIDFNVSNDLPDFDWKTDSRDGGNHLNNSGAKKVTQYIGNYLKQNYPLNDYRGNKNYQDWEEDYEFFMKKINKK